MQGGAEVPFLRPIELSSDIAHRNDVVAHALNEIPGYDYVILLQPTSPLRTSRHIDEAFEYFLDSGSGSCVSVTQSHSPPEWMYYQNSDNSLAPILLSGKPEIRQKVRPAYTLNGAIYISKVESFLDSKFEDSFVNESTVAYIMDQECSFDIDSPLDFQICDFLINRGAND